MITSKQTEKFMICSTQSFEIQSTPAHGEGPTIPIPIGVISNFERLNEENFAKVCEIINQVTLTPHYPTGVNRSNHNGTHSARQARMMEVIFDLFVTGPQEALAKEFSPEERMHIKLAAYLLRAGRIDESYHLDPNPDDYYTRSAMIYKAYADQLDISPETSSWLYKNLVNSCKPTGIRETYIDEDPKSLLCWNLLTVVHELDLIRCYSRHEIDGRIKQKMADELSIYVQNPTLVVDLLLQFSKDLCVSTGCYRVYDRHSGNKKLFRHLSKEGGKCWEVVSKVPFSTTPPKAEESLISRIGTVAAQIFHHAFLKIAFIAAAILYYLKHKSI